MHTNAHTDARTTSVRWRRRRYNSLIHAMAQKDMAAERPVIEDGPGGKEADAERVIVRGGDIGNWCALTDVLLLRGTGRHTARDHKLDNR